MLMLEHKTTGGIIDKNKDNRSFNFGGGAFVEFIGPVPGRCAQNDGRRFSL